MPCCRCSNRTSSPHHVLLCDCVNEKSDMIRAGPDKAALAEKSGESQVETIAYPLLSKQVARQACSYCSHLLSICLSFMHCQSCSVVCSADVADIDDADLVQFCPRFLTENGYSLEWILLPCLGTGSRLPASCGACLAKHATKRHQNRRWKYCEMFPDISESR